MGMIGERETVGVIWTGPRGMRAMNSFFKDASVAFAILSAAMSGQALAQGPRRGGFGPSPQMQAAAKAQTEAATAQMHAYLNDIAYKMLAERAKRVAAIERKTQAGARRDEVRRRIVELVGGIPASTGPVNAKSFDSIKEDGFTIENIAYESCPNYWVTANVYVPDRKGPSRRRRFLHHVVQRATPGQRAPRRGTDAARLHRERPGLRRLGRAGRAASFCDRHLREGLFPDRRREMDIRGSAANLLPVRDGEQPPADPRPVRADVRRLAGVSADETQLPKVTLSPLKQADGYQTESLRIESEPGIVLPGVLGSPASGGTHPVIVWMEPTPVEAISRSPEFVRLVRAGNIVVAFHPRDVLGEPQSGPEQLALGQYMPELLRAVVVGKTIVGMRVDDLVRGVNWVCARADVDRKQILLYAKGGLGMAAIHAAAIDERIGRVVVENSHLAYRTALEASLHKNLSEVVIPGVLTRYDTPSSCRPSSRGPSIYTLHGAERAIVGWASPTDAGLRPGGRWAKPTLQECLIDPRAAYNQPHERDGARAQESIRRRGAIDGLRAGQGVGPARSDQARTSRLW
jgi:hypothetical protein